MAKTLKIHQILSELRPSLGAKIDDTVFAALMMNRAIDFIWDAGDWSFAIAEIPPFFLVPEESDYGPPTSAVPSDILLLREAWIRDVDGVSFKNLAVVRNLPRVEQTGLLPEVISHEPEIPAFRVSPTPGSSIAATRFQVEGSYKKAHTKITPANLTSETVPFDDRHSEVLSEVFLWRAYQRLQSPAQGQINFVSGTIQATGQAGNVLAALEKMMQQEGISNTADLYAPESSLLQ